MYVFTESAKSEQNPNKIPNSKSVRHDTSAAFFYSCTVYRKPACYDNAFKDEDADVCKALFRCSKTRWTSAKHMFRRTSAKHMFKSAKHMFKSAKHTFKNINYV